MKKMENEFEKEKEERKNKHDMEKEQMNKQFQIQMGMIQMLMLNQFNQNSIKNTDVRNDIKSGSLPKESPVIKKEINDDKIRPFFNTIKTNNKIKENVSSNINSRLTENKSNAKVNEIT